MSDKFFTILLDDTVDITDKSLQLKEYNTPAVSLALTGGDTLYIGYSKPFDSFFLELEDKSLAGAELAGEYYNGSSWTSLVVYDETQGLSKSGFIYFEKPEDMASVAVDGKSKFYIRLTASVDTGAVSGKLLDILFSSDIDLEKIREGIVNRYSVNNTFVSKHIAARDHIIQDIRNKGNVKEVKKNEGLITEEILYKDITKFDFLEPLQLRVAATYLALYFIFWYELSDEEGDKWQLKAAEMYRLYTEAMNTFFIALDLDDDGKQGEDDKAQTDAIRTIVLGGPSVKVSENE